MVELWKKTYGDAKNVIMGLSTQVTEHHFVFAFTIFVLLNTISKFSFRIIRVGAPYSRCMSNLGSVEIHSEVEQR